MFAELRTATRLLAAFTVLTGVVYPLLVTAVAQGVFPHQANGSLLPAGGRSAGERTSGSELIGQSFSKPEYFWGRLSATAPFPYNAGASTGSNYGPLHPALQEGAQARLTALRQGGAELSHVPVDLVTASGSGLDPHISPAAAEFQVQRVAAARRMKEEEVRQMIREQTEGRQFGLLGEPRVHVLRLNLALDRHRSAE